MKFFSKLRISALHERLFGNSNVTSSWEAFVFSFVYALKVGSAPFLCFLVADEISGQY